MTRAMQSLEPYFTLRLADRETDLLGAQRLRYRVFVSELGGDGALVDHERRLERDAYDDSYDHLVLIDDRRDPESLDHVVGVYRLMRGTQADGAAFYCADEYDLGPLLATGRRLLELGRSCVDADYRGGTAMFRLWQGLGSYATREGVDLLFGVASFHGTDVAALAEPLSLLHHDYLAPPDLRVRALPPGACRMDRMAPEAIDRRRAMAAMPALIKAYLRLGGVVGEGAFVDAPFRTTDVCLVMDTNRLSARSRALYVDA